jgi:hypothetical protein
MFATLLGSLPRPPLPDDASRSAVLEAVLELQAGHGLEPLTAAGWGTWSEAKGRTELLVKGTLAGPIGYDRPVEAVRLELDRMLDGGCTWIEIDEPLAGLARGDVTTARFAAAHAALTDGVAGVHLSLVLTGASADWLGAAALLAGAYASYAFDLRDGPDSWRVITALPGDRGIIAGAVTTTVDGDDSPELLLYAVGYAASTGGRGADRVGLSTAGSLGHLEWADAARKVARLGDVALLAAAPVDERRAAIDPRAVDIRSAALGRYDPPEQRPGGTGQSTKSRKSSSPGD